MGWDVWAAPPSAGVVLRASGAAQEAVALARGRLGAAGQVAWVSSAAAAYGALLDAAAAEVALVAARVPVARDAVLPHVRAADAARAAAAEPGADLRAAVRDLARPGAGTGAVAWPVPAPVLGSPGAGAAP
ncbi:hypothetical protein [Actinotalea solisilvae]|uniref:hypothetical protein n=1 Tax=Actinotalea solisilvae TaxID=2072922 RepID=UPI0018F11C59|nr:hypothetical protein [Actinotalea solisilvae]